MWAELWYMLSQWFTPMNALTFGLFMIPVYFLIHVISEAWRKHADHEYRSNVVHPDGEGRYPLIVKRNRTGWAIYDQVRSWGLTQLNNIGESVVNATPIEVIEAYREIEIARAEANAMVPAEMTYTYSPADTYAPSNQRDATLVDNAGDQNSADILEKLIDGEEKPKLPTSVNFFDYINQREPGNIILGLDEQGGVIQIPLFDVFHQLIGGMSGHGKSVYLRSLVLQLLMERENTNIQIGLADIENNTFPEFREKDGIRWYAGSFVEIRHMTDSLLKDLEARKLLYEQFGSATPKDIVRYNIMARRENKAELPVIVVIYDEFTALMNKSQQAAKDIIRDIFQLALRARKYGIFLVFAGHSYKADLIDTTVLGQFGFNICFRVRTVHTSMSVLGEPGAEQLLQPGEALIRTKVGEIRRMQGLFIDDDELLAALDGFQSNNGESMVPDLVRSIVCFAYEKLDSKVLIKQIEPYFKTESGASRSDVFAALYWMDEHGFVSRDIRNGRVLNLGNEQVAHIVKGCDSDT